MQEWASSNNQCLDPSDHEVATLQQRTGLSSTQVSKWLQKEQRKILKATHSQHDSENNPQRKRKRKRMAKGSGYRATLEIWVQEHDGRLWQSDEEFSDTLQSLSCSKTQVTSWFAYRRKKARLELERAFRDPRGFIARNGNPGHEIIQEFFMAARSGGTPPRAGKDLVRA